MTRRSKETADTHPRESGPPQHTRRTPRLHRGPCPPARDTHTRVPRDEEEESGLRGQTRSRSGGGSSNALEVTPVYQTFPEWRKGWEPTYTGEPVSARREWGKDVILQECRITSRPPTPPQTQRRLDLPQIVDSSTSGASQGRGLFILLNVSRT